MLTRNQDKKVEPVGQESAHYRASENPVIMQESTWENSKKTFINSSLSKGLPGTGEAQQQSIQLKFKPIEASSHPGMSTIKPLIDKEKK